MAEKLLITKEDIAEKYWLGKNIDLSRINNHILRAQQSDLKPLLGEYLYWDVLNNSATPANAMLINGGFYDPENVGNTGGGDLIECENIIVCTDIIGADVLGGIYFAGLKDYLCSSAFARIEKANDTFVTRGGNKNKNILESEKQPQEKTNHDVQGARSDAIRIQEEILRFLDFKRNEYPLWQVTTSSEERPRKTSFRITKV